MSHCFTLFWNSTEENKEEAKEVSLIAIKQISMDASVEAVSIERNWELFSHE